MNPETLDKAASLVRELASTLGQPALDVALRAAWVDAASIVIKGAMWGVLAVFLGMVCARRAKAFLAEVQKSSDEFREGAAAGNGIATIATAIAWMIFTVIALNTFRISALLSLWQPEVWLVLKVLP